MARIEPRGFETDFVEGRLNDALGIDGVAQDREGEISQVRAVA
jgi:hypothetical protein